QEVSVFVTADFRQARPHASMFWVTPDGREIPLVDSTLRASESFRLSQDARLTRRLRGQAAEIGLFADPDADAPKPLKGTYQLVVDGPVLERGADRHARLDGYGQPDGL